MDGGVTVAELINVAKQRLQAGQFEEAKSAFQQVLARQPKSAEALHGMGLIARQEGRREEAVELIRRGDCDHARGGAIAFESGHVSG